MNKQTTVIYNVSNREKVLKTILTFPGLRFYQLKTETQLSNGTLQHHVNSLIKSKQVIINYDNTIPRYFSPNIDITSQIVIKRLGQKTTSKIIKLLLKRECQTFSQIVKYSKKSPGTISVYKNMLLDDNIIKGTTDGCKFCKNSDLKIKYRLVNPEKVRTLIMEYGKNRLDRITDNLADIFLSIK